MSHFVEMKVNFKQKNEKDLVASLENLFGAGTVEVHEDGAPLYGYQGDDRSKHPTGSADYAPKCHVIIRRKNVGGASNDVGYRRTEDGQYVAYISDYDKGSNYSPVKQNKVAVDYAETVASRQLKKQGYIVKRTVNEKGQIKLTASKWS